MQNISHQTMSSPNNRDPQLQHLRENPSNEIFAPKTASGFPYPSEFPQSAAAFHYSIPAALAHQSSTVQHHPASPHPSSAGAFNPYMSMATAAGGPQVHSQNPFQAHHANPMMNYAISAAANHDPAFLHYRGQAAVFPGYLSSNNYPTQASSPSNVNSFAATSFHPGSIAARPPLQYGSPPPGTQLIDINARSDPNIPGKFTIFCPIFHLLFSTQYAILLF